MKRFAQQQPRFFDWEEKKKKELEHTLEQVWRKCIWLERSKLSANDHRLITADQLKSSLLAHAGSFHNIFSLAKWSGRKKRMSLLRRIGNICQVVDSTVQIHHLTNVKRKVITLVASYLIGPKVSTCSKSGPIMSYRSLASASRDGIHTFLRSRNRNAP